MFNWPILVVLLPALLCAVLAIFVTVPPWLARHLASVEYKEMLRDVFLGLTGAGTTVGAIVGVQEGTFASWMLIVFFAATMLLVVHALTVNIAAQRARDESRDQDLRQQAWEQFRNTWRD